MTVFTEFESGFRFAN